MCRAQFLALRAAPKRNRALSERLNRTGTIQPWPEIAQYCVMGWLTRRLTHRPMLNPQFGP